MYVIIVSKRTNIGFVFGIWKEQDPITIVSAIYIHLARPHCPFLAYI